MVVYQSEFKEAEPLACVLCVCVFVCIKGFVLGIWPPCLLVRNYCLPIRPWNLSTGQEVRKKKLMWLRKSKKKLEHTATKSWRPQGRLLSVLSVLVSNLDYAFIFQKAGFFVTELKTVTWPRSKRSWRKL